MEKITELKSSYRVLVTDYETEKKYVYDKVFDTFGDAVRFIKAVQKVETRFNVCSYSVDEIPALPF